MLDAEADEITKAHCYERTEGRTDTRAGHNSRKLVTKAGEVKLKVPKLRNLPFETAIIERYKRREESVEEALIEMYLAGVSVRRVEDISEALWGVRVSPGTISNMNQNVYAEIEKWRNRELVAEYPFQSLQLPKNLKVLREGSCFFISGSFRCIISPMGTPPDVLDFAAT